jgi:hypothetical protein
MLCRARAQHRNHEPHLFHSCLGPSCGTMTGCCPTHSMWPLITSFPENERKYMKYMKILGWLTRNTFALFFILPLADQSCIQTRKSGRMWDLRDVPPKDGHVLNGAGLAPVTTSGMHLGHSDSAVGNSVGKEPKSPL